VLLEYTSEKKQSKTTHIKYRIKILVIQDIHAGIMNAIS